ncbi:MAG: O-acetylhomoserine aminocarboxypropyltransferase/cysteine synthase [Flavobacteriales bacterium]|nr:O-acetylhomoserine aminocarboxypropyltransferase/cysteine synthase [Flavobacteriales bacterium]
MTTKKQKTATIALHGNFNPKSHQSSCAVPIYLTSAYAFESADSAAKIFSLSQSGYIYSRLNNPTTDVLEQRLAALEGGVAACVFSSGTAALFSALLTLLKSGDHLVSSAAVYGGSYTMFALRLPRLGIGTTIVESEKIEDFEKAIRPNTKAIFIEALPNPQLTLLDIEALADVAHKHKIPLIVDNTVATSALLRPIEHGADIVTYSLTKYMQGHGTTMAGAVIDSGNFDWKASGLFPEFTEPDPAYHGLVYADLGPAAFATKLRTEGLRDIGACLNPFAAFEVLQGLETLDVRMERHSKNALSFAQYLEKNENVDSVTYPALKSNPYHSLSEKYLPNGASGLLSFRIKGGYERAKRFVDSLQIFNIVANLGDVKSIVTHPASTTHQQLTTEERNNAGVYDNLIRVAVGIEDVNDLIADFEQGFQKSK